MINRLKWLAIRLLLGGDFTTATLLMSQQIILGKLRYRDIPSGCQAAVAEALTDSGLTELINM
ncbi:MAG: hypothetical protein LUG13_02690 [Oscillospiraceae bacterium]|nr:hypothetical protein [Oscillospiraceae bacterium]